MQQHTKIFKYSYVADSTSVEVFEMPLHVYEQYVSNKAMKGGKDFQKMQAMVEQKDVMRSARVLGSQKAIQEVMTRKATDSILMNNFLAVLPLLDISGGSESDHVAEDAKTLSAFVTRRASSVQTALEATGASPLKPEPPSIELPSKYKYAAYVTPKQKAVDLYKEMLKMN
jgi:hypothetical protein